MAISMDFAFVVLSILVLGVLVTIHEAGHYFAAKWGGMKVSRFSIGFGPAIIKSERGGTVFQVGIIPLGGFVQIDGMHPEDGSDPTASDSYLNRPKHYRAAAVLAGPAANYIFAFFILVIFYTAFAVEFLPPFKVGSVRDGSAAMAAGLQPGDVLVGTSSTTFSKVTDLKEAIQGSSGSMVFKVEREGETLMIPVSPKKVADSYLVGIAYQPLGTEPLQLSFPEAVGRAASHVYGVTAQLLTLLTQIGRQSLSGPIGIVRDLSSAAQQSMLALFSLSAQLSIALGFFNLLPIPGLDGARLAFLAASSIRGKEIEPRFEAAVHGIGILILLIFLLIVSWFDIQR